MAWGGDCYGDKQRGSPYIYRGTVTAACRVYIPLCGQAGRGYQSYIFRCIPARTGDKRRTDEGGGSCDKEEVLEMYGI